MASKNPWLKSRKPGNPYAVVEANGWKWEILKAYKGPEASLKDPYSRVFCNVSSPIVPDGEMGDVYVKDIFEVAPRRAAEVWVAFKAAAEEVVS